MSFVNVSIYSSQFKVAKVTSRYFECWEGLMMVMFVSIFLTCQEYCFVFYVNCVHSCAAFVANLFVENHSNNVLPVVSICFKASGEFIY